MDSLIPYPGDDGGYGLISALILSERSFRSASSLLHRYEIFNIE